MTLIGNAIAIAAEVHKDQTDKGGQPYIYHVLEVAKRAGERYDIVGKLSGEDPIYREWVVLAAILHDTIEDFEGPSYQKQHLRNRIYAEFSAEVDSALDHLTKYEGEEYDSYIERVAGSWIARIVKLADLSHNLEAWRIPSGKITEKDYARWDKYHRAFVRLMRED